MPTRERTNPLALLVLLACVGVSACSGKFPGVYRIPIQQGNVITVEMLQELKLGMDKRKVRFVLGTPLVTDVFHLDRWDYFYSYEPGSSDRVQQRASLFFEDGRLARIDADIKSDIDFHTVTQASGNVLIVPPKKGGGFFAALTPAFLEKDEEAAAEQEIARTLDTGFNDPQPGSTQSLASTEPSEVFDPALAATAAIGPSTGDTPVPSEIYVPNSSAGGEEAAATWSTAPGGAQGSAAGAWSTAPGGAQAGAAAAWSTMPAGAQASSDDAAWSAAASGAETVSAEIESQSTYLEQLFDDFGAATAVQAAPAEEAASAAPTSVPRDATHTTRD